MKRIPQHAEHTFAALCAARGAVCNKAGEDATGWDYVVEFPPAPRPWDVPRDMRPEGVPCLVQVKSTTLGKPSTRIKLSNALRFVNSPLPCFVVLFLYGPDGGRRGTYVAHFWRDLITETLKSVRGLAAEGREDLHRRHLRIVFAPGDGVEDPVERIGKEIDGIDNYGVRKARIVSHAGFDGGLGEASIRFADGITMDRVVDMQLGLGGPLDVSRFRFTTRRFGIAADPPLAAFETGTIQIEARPVGTCVVSLSSMGASTGIDVVSDVHLPSQAGLPPEHFKIRIVSAIFELTAKPYDDVTTFRILVPREPRLPMADLAKLLSLRGMLAAGPVDCQVRKDDVTFLSGTISVTGFVEHPGWGQVREFLVHVTSRVTPERLATAAIALPDLGGRIAEIADFLALTGEDELLVSSDEARDDLTVGTGCTVLMAARVDLDACTVCTIVRRRGEIGAGEGSGSVLELGGPACIRTMVLVGPSPSRSDVIDKELARFAEAESRGATSPVIVIPRTANRIAPRTAR